jgi:hypothetical protein
LAAWRQLLVPTDLSPELQHELEGINKLQLVKPGDTRFASAFTMLERVKKLKNKLRQYAVADTFEATTSTMRAADQVR